MADIQFRPNRAGMVEFLKSRPVQDMIDRKTQSIAAAAGPGYQASTVIGRNRVHGSVITGTYAARIDNARHQTLLRSMGAGRG